MRRLRMGMVGGGQGAFIGAVHRMAAALDGQFEFVAGALSSTPTKPGPPDWRWASANTAVTPPGRPCSKVNCASRQTNASIWCRS
ncbi:hypothetical protein ACFSC4_21915 [Deinococcus malanensis]|uniref:hypothetical protein n=1 Tax=Deinococcus malanensis TaxID=1706855 RepID=UPI003635EA92